MPDETSADLRSSVKAASRMLDPSNIECPEDPVWIEYHRQALTADRMEALQVHLLHCPSCREVLQDAATFLEDGQSPTAARLEDWKAIENKLPGRAHTSRVQPRFMLYALAASVTALCLTAGWAWQAQRTLQTERATSDLLERENRQLREHQLAKRLPPPAVGMQLFDLFPQNSIARSGGASGRNQVVVKESAPFALIAAAPVSRRSAYRLELRDAQGRTLLAEPSVTPDSNGNVVIAFSQGGLTQGAYSLLLFPSGDPADTVLASYSVTLRFESGLNPKREKPAQK